MKEFACSSEMEQTSVEGRKESLDRELTFRRIVLDGRK